MQRHGIESAQLAPCRATTMPRKKARTISGDTGSPTQKPTAAGVETGQNSDQSDENLQKLLQNQLRAAQRQDQVNFYLTARFLSVIIVIVIT